MWREDELIVEGFNPDQELITSALEKSTEFFKHATLPELLRKCYTKLPSQVSSSHPVLCPRKQTHFLHQRVNQKPRCPHQVQVHKLGVHAGRKRRRNMTA